MPINWEKVRTDLYKWATSQIPVNMPAIFYFENSPRPTVDYITLYLNSIVQIGDDYLPRPLDSPGNVQLVGNREFTLQIQGYGGDPMSVLETLRYSLQKPTVLDTLRANGIVFVNYFPINDITQLVDSRFEKRAQMDILFRIAQSYSDTIGSIDTVEIQEIYEEADGTVVYDEVQTVTTVITP